MESKLSKLKAAAAAGDWDKAIGIAAKFPQLGTDRAAILDAQLAITNPRFCTQLRKEPGQLREKGIEALRSRYGI